MKERSKSIRNKFPTEEEIIDEVRSLKKFLKSFDFQMGIGGANEKKIFNRINKILRLLKSPIRRVELSQDKTKEKVE